ncbi:MAG: ABC transporter substrate-binding protein [Chloroflexi bacterium]|nr:ABC transporter substrate-binding protein [Chloroflexota bacterium]
MPADAAAQQTLKLVIGGFGSQEPLAPWSVRWGGQDVAAYEFLSPVFTDVDFKLQPLLAKSITPNADFTVWTIKVDPRAVWSDGTKVTAKHMKDSWEWEADPAQKTSSTPAYALSDAKGFQDMAGGKAKEISGLVVKDDETLDVQLNNPDRFLDHKFGIYWMGVVPVDKLKADPQYLSKPNPVVNGPFQATQIDATGRQIVLTPNPKWWGDKPIIQRIEVTIAEENSALEVLAEKGQADLAYSFADVATRLKLLERTPGAAKVSFKLPSGVYASFHWNVPPLDDINVRKALIHAIDFKQLAQTATDGTLQPWLAALHPELIVGCYNPDSEKYFAYDPAKAKQELAASKYGSADKLGKLRITPNTTSVPVGRAFQIIQEYWRTNLGITDVESKPQPAGFGADEKLINLDRQSIGARPPDDGLWISQFKSNLIHATRFMAGYKNEALDKVADQLSALDRKDPNFCKTVQQAEKLFLDDYMLLPLWRQSGDFGIVQPWVKNLKLNPFLVPYGLMFPPFAYVAKH